MKRCEFEMGLGCILKTNVDVSQTPVQMAYQRLQLQAGLICQRPDI